MNTQATENDVVYGLNPAFEALLAGRRKIMRASLGRQALRNPRVKKLESLCRQRDIPIETHEKGRLIHLAGSRDHQGVVLETSPYPYGTFEDAVADVDRLLLLDNMEVPQNVGAILRSAEILGFKTVLLPQKGVPGVYPSVVKASAGATEHLTIIRDMNAPQYAKRLLAEGWQLVPLDAGGTVAPEEFQNEPGAKAALVIGGENKGVHQFILNNARVVLRIPQQGRINSLNASVAAGIAMYELAKALGS